MRRGYTLIEMLVVVALLTVVAAFAVPTYQLILAQAQLTSAAAEVSDFLLTTQQKTVTEQKIYGVTLTTLAYTIPQYTYDPISQTKTATTTFSLPSNTQIYEVNFSGNSDIRFATTAAPNVSGNVVIKDLIRNRLKKITIAPSGTITANQPEYSP
jgi:prepilin-type N-terminal cleavage/methylation domain-containing protein